jgi:hypothetical protein
MEIQMVMGIAKPHQRSEKNLGWQSFGNTLDDFSKQQAVGPNRQMMAVLFDGRDGKNDRGILVQGLDLFPGKFN